MGAGDGCRLARGSKGVGGEGLVTSCYVPLWSLGTSLAPTFFSFSSSIEMMAVYVSVAFVFLIPLLLALEGIKGLFVVALNLGKCRETRVVLLVLCGLLTTFIIIIIASGVLV